MCAEQLDDGAGAQLHAFVRARPEFARVAFALLSEGGRAPFPLSARDLALDAALPTEELWRRLAPLAGTREEGAPDAGRGAQMRGEIAALGLFELLGSLQQTRKTGQLTLHLGELDADLFLQHGEVAHVEYLGLYGEAAFLRAVDAANQAEQAEFTFETLSPGEVSALPRTVERTTERLLLEIAVRLDHARAGKSGG